LIKNSVKIGLDSQKLVLSYLLGKSFTVIKSNWRTPFGEIDLFVVNQNQKYFVIEVKTVSNPSYQNFISNSQLLRQKKIVQWLYESYAEISWYLAIVTKDKKIKFINLENQ